MSNPQNRLAQFRSYTAHHSLVMCDGMKTANSLTNNSQMFSTEPNDPELLFNVEAVELPGDEGGTEQGLYIVLFDGRRDANYFIKSVSWETILSPIGPLGDSKYDVIETDGEMVIEEPFGIEFLEVLVKGADRLGVDPSGIVFILKTFFVGINDNGEQVVIDDIRPFTFIMIDLTAEMKAGGSLYKILLFGTSNGVSKLPQISSIGNGLSIRLQKGEPLSSAIQKLESEISRKYNEFKTKLIPELAADIRRANSSNLDASDARANSLIADKFSDVVYKFNLDPVYQGRNYIVGTNKSHNQIADGDEFILKFSENSSVETCIRKVMETCKFLTEEGVENKDTRRSYSPKIATTLDPPDDGVSYQILYNIRRYETIYQPYGSNYVPEPGEFIVLDYIYTGKNTDILDYDIKMDMGLSFFQTNLTPKGTQSTQADAIQGVNAPDGITARSGTDYRASEAAGTEKIPAKRRAPLFLGMTIPPSMYNDDINQLTNASFEQNLARHVALENIQARVKIVGNPNLLNESLADDYSAENINITDESTGLADIAAKPGLVKINIKYPSTKELTGVKDFWYDGYFNIFSIINDFSDGVFTQTLDLFSLPASSALPADVAQKELQTNARDYEQEAQFRHEVNRSQFESDANQDGGSIKIAYLPVGVFGSPAEQENIDPTVDLWLKSGVRFGGSKSLDDIEPEIENILDDIVSVWKEHTTLKPVVTSANDSKHSQGSLHFKNFAIDLRANNLNSDINVAVDEGRIIARALSRRIGRDYDVIYENYPGRFSNNHIHVEYDPKFFTPRFDPAYEEGNG